ncbi:unnamed protein product, partial [Polarella glacialis]
KEKKNNRQYPNAPPAVVELMDLNSLESVRNFAKTYTGPVDVLVNNAATLGSGELRRTGDGFEECLQVNYLSGFLLTSLLLDRVEQSAAGRIVHVSAKAHEWANISVQAMVSEKVLGPDFVSRQGMMGNLGGSYADSKLDSAMVKFLQEQVLQRIGRVVGFMQTKEDAPKTQVHVATHPALQKAGGRYYSPIYPPLVGCGKAAEDCAVSEVSDAALDVSLQEDLFKATCTVLALQDGLCARGASE